MLDFSQTLLIQFITPVWHAHTGTVVRRYFAHVHPQGLRRYEVCVSYSYFVIKWPRAMAPERPSGCGAVTMSNHTCGLDSRRASPVCAFDPWFLQIHLGSCFRQRLLLFFKRQSRMIFRFTDFRKSCLFTLGGLFCLPLMKIVGFSMHRTKPLLSLRMRLLKTFVSRLDFLLCEHIATSRPVLVWKVWWTWQSTTVKPAVPNFVFHPLPIMQGVVAISSPEL